MFKHGKTGDCEGIRQVEMPDATRELLREILAQNRMILEANCMTMRLLEHPIWISTPSSQSEYAQPGTMAHETR